MVPVRGLVLAAALAAIAAGGCATSRVTTQPIPVRLDVPVPPPRIIVPPEPEPEPAEVPAPAPEPETHVQKPPRRPPAVVPARPETKTDATTHTAPPAQPPATLQQALPTSPADLVRQVRDQLAQAQSDLRRVDYLGLNADAKSQYDTAKQFIAQAEQALTQKNLVFAAKVAEKAAGLAASLVGRIPS
jgi:outer membrane biosynthesis protein TonB